MKLCGIELKSNNAIVSVIETIDDETSYINTKSKKFILEDDEKKDSILKFKNEIESFLKENKIEKIALKKRAKKGTFAGGAVTFKSEAIIQLNDICDVSFITSQAISKYSKSNDVILPNDLNKYQEQAYLSSLLLI
jgi:hypothetical protein